MQGGEENKGTSKVKKGWLAVLVGGTNESSRRFVIPIAYLYHPLFRRLLEAARDAFGYDYSAGPLRLPCSVDEFLRLRALVDRETTQLAGGSSSHRVRAAGGGHGSHHHHSSSFSSACTRAKVTS